MIGREGYSSRSPKVYAHPDLTVLATRAVMVVASMRPIADLRSELAQCVVFFFQAEDGTREYKVTGVQTCALPIYQGLRTVSTWSFGKDRRSFDPPGPTDRYRRSEEHTSELQSPCNLVCRLLL